MQIFIQTTWGLSLRVFVLKSSSKYSGVLWRWCMVWPTLWLKHTCTKRRKLKLGLANRNVNKRAKVRFYSSSSYECGQQDLQTCFRTGLCSSGSFCTQFPGGWIISPHRPSTKIHGVSDELFSLIAWCLLSRFMFFSKSTESHGFYF